MHYRATIFLALFVALLPNSWCGAQDELRLEALELGDDYAAVGNWEEALREYESALNDPEDDLSRRAYRRIGIVHLRKAKAYQAREAFGPARVEADFALELFQQHQPEWAPSVHNLRAGLALATGDLFDALAAYNAGLASFHALPATPLPRPHPDSLTADGLAEATLLLGGRARLLASSDQALEALADYELLFHLQDRRGREVAFTDGRTFLNLDARVYYDRAIDLLVAYHAETGEEALLWDAFRLSQRARQQDLLNFLRLQRAERDEREEHLQNRITDLRQLSVTDDQHTTDLEAAELQLDRLLHTRPKAKLAKPAPTAGREVLPVLRARRQTLALFHLGEEAGHLFLLRPDTAGMQHLTLPPRREVTKLVKQFRADLAKGRQAPDDAAYITSGSRVYRALFRELPGLSHQLVVVPDGPLRALSFSALPAAVGEDISSARRGYLGGEGGVTYLHAPAELLEEASRGIPRFELDFLSISPAREPLGSPENHFPGHLIITGPEADRESFMAQAGRARILHLNSPTNARGDQLNFTTTVTPLTPERTLLLGDLATMNLRAELFIAPQTWRPANQAFIDLPVALAAAGAKSSLTSLWPVPDDEFLRHFYGHIARGVRGKEALSRALAKRRGSEHPYYWANYQLYGKARSLVPAEKEKSRVFYWLGAAAALLLLVGIFLKSRAPAA